jgi:uncharacterized membrane protein
MRVKNILFLLFVFDLFLVLWGLMVAVQTFFVDADILKFPEENIRLLFILFILFAVTSMGGLVAAILYNKKYYIKLFPALQVVVFIAMLGAKSIFG